MVVAAISAIFVAPLAEELVFRVVLQGWLERQIELLTEHRRIYGERFARLFAIVIARRPSRPCTGVMNGFQFSCWG